MDYSRKIILVRHGETAWALSGKHTGMTDIPLTEHGCTQALALKKVLREFHPVKALVSPLQRAFTTFSLVDLSIPYEIEDRLVEWNYGEYEGMTSAEIRQQSPGWTIFDSGAPGGESVHQIELRVESVISKVNQIEGDIILFSSGHILRSLTAKWLQMPIAFGKHLPLSTASVSVLGFERQTPALLLWNRTALP